MSLIKNSWIKRFLDVKRLKRKVDTLKITMKTLNERIADVSLYLQSLTAPEFSSQVQDAVERKDKNSLIKVCKKAKISSVYLGTIVSVLLSVGPEQKWPPTI
jgi:hypothetical protein